MPTSVSYDRRRRMTPLSRAFYILAEISFLVSLWIKFIYFPSQDFLDDSFDLNDSKNTNDSVPGEESGNLEKAKDVTQLSFDESEEDELILSVVESVDSSFLSKTNDRSFTGSISKDPQSSKDDEDIYFTGKSVQSNIFHNIQTENRGEIEFLELYVFIMLIFLFIITNSAVLYSITGMLLAICEIGYFINCLGALGNLCRNSITIHKMPRYVISFPGNLWNAGRWSGDLLIYYFIKRIPTF